MIEQRPHRGRRRGGRRADMLQRLERRDTHVRVIEEFSQRGRGRRRCLAVLAQRCCGGASLLHVIGGQRGDARVDGFTPIGRRLVLEPGHPKGLPPGQGLGAQPLDEKALRACGWQDATLPFYCTSYSMQKRL